MSVPVTLADYLQLVTSQYQIAPNMLAWLSANLQLFLDQITCIESIPSALDINLAVGAQLDLLGVIIGQPRTVAFQPTGGVSPVLDDTTYRLLLKAQVLNNHWNGKIDSLIQNWQIVFPGGFMIFDDLQNMTVNVFVAGAFTSISQDLVTQGYILPRPQGVLYNITFATLPIFGFDRNDAFVAGFDTGHFS